METPSLPPLSLLRDTLTDKLTSESPKQRDLVTGQLITNTKHVLYIPLLQETSETWDSSRIGYPEACCMRTLSMMLGIHCTCSTSQQVFDSSEGGYGDTQVGSEHGDSTATIFILPPTKPRIQDWKKNSRKTCIWLSLKGEPSCLVLSLNLVTRRLQDLHQQTSTIRQFVNIYIISPNRHTCSDMPAQDALHPTVRCCMLPPGKRHCK